MITCDVCVVCPCFHLQDGFLRELPNVRTNLCSDIIYKLGSIRLYAHQIAKPTLKKEILQMIGRSRHAYKGTRKKLQIFSF